MSYDPVPNTWIPGWEAAGTVITIPAAFTTAFPEMTLAEATGDIGNVTYAILHKIFARWAELPVADRPANWRIYKNSSLDPNTDKETVTFSLSFDMTVAPGQKNVAAG